METLVWNPLKQKLETISSVELSDKNTTWFDDIDCEKSIRFIADINGGLLIATWSYEYPVWIAGTSRSEINFDKETAGKLKEEYELECC